MFLTLSKLDEYLCYSGEPLQIGREQNDNIYLQLYYENSKKKVHDDSWQLKI